MYEKIKNPNWTGKKINLNVAIISILFVSSIIAFFLFKTKGAEAPAMTQKIDVPQRDIDEKSQAAGETDDWLDFKNYKYGYEIKFSRAMTVNDDNPGDVIVSFAFREDAVFLFEIKIIPTGKNYDFDAILKKALAKELEGGRILNKEEIMIDGEKGYALSNCGKFECMTQRWAVVKDGHLYLLRSVNALPKDFELMFSTFKFIN